MSNTPIYTKFRQALGYRNGHFFERIRPLRQTTPKSWIFTSGAYYEFDTNFDAPLIDKNGYKNWETYTCVEIILDCEAINSYLQSKKPLVEIALIIGLVLGYLHNDKECYYTEQEIRNIMENCDWAAVYRVYCEQVANKE